jgi:hypothetical protein
MIQAEPQMAQYVLTRHASMACSMSMAEHPKADWFRVQALECIGLALRAKDPRVKRLYALEAERWLRLAELQVDSAIRDGGPSSGEYRGVERRMTPRRLSPTAGAILLEPESPIECMVRDFSPAGVGLILTDTITLPVEFDLAFDDATRHCITVWRQGDRMGLKFKSTY